jgi:thiol-disulfide isomerase/thioredoxin
MNDVKPFWYFIAGFVILYLFMLLLRPRGGYRPYPGPGPAPYRPGLLGPGGTRHMFYEGFAGAQPEFIMFGTEWCGYCKKAKPEFEKLATMTTGVQTRFVDADKDKASMQGFQVDGYPTFYLVTAQGTPVKYAGDRTASAMAQWIQQQLK